MVGMHGDLQMQPRNCRGSTGAMFDHGRIPMLKVTIVDRFLETLFSDLDFEHVKLPTRCTYLDIWTEESGPASKMISLE